MLLVILLAMLLISPCNCALGQTESVSRDPIPIVTLCEVLSNLSSYNKKSIILIGKLSGTTEGVWLSEDCEKRIVTEGYAWGNHVSTTYIVGRTDPPPLLPEGFVWDHCSIMKKLKASKDYRDSRSFDGWMAIFGRLETRIPPRVYEDGRGKIQGLGYGHLNGSIAQLISCSNCTYSPQNRELSLLPGCDDSAEGVN